MKIRSQTRENIAGYAFILPNLIGFIIFAAFPVGFSFFIGLTNWDIFTRIKDVEFVGFQNYLEMFTDPWFITSMKNNFFFLCFLPVEIFLALVIAVMLNGKIPGKTFLRTTFYLPNITSYVVVTMIWLLILRPDEGIVNAFLYSIGVKNPPRWFASSLWVKPSIVLMRTWNTLGYHMILYLAGLQSIDKSLYEASHIDGANRIKQFIYITIPMISPVTFFILIMAVINNFKMWTTVQLLTGGGPGDSSTVLGYYIYKNAFEYMRMGYAASMSWILLIIILIITLIQWRGQKKWVNY